MPQNETPCHCGLCDWTGDASECKKDSELFDDLEPGDAVPVGRCPRATCEYSVYLDDPEEEPTTELLDTLRTVTEYLEEAHADEIENDHHGDETCSYCDAIANANAIIAKATA